MVDTLKRGGIGLVAIAVCRAAAAGDWAVDSFCAEVQRVTAETNVQAELVIHRTSGAYRASKPGIDPVVIHQYITPDATGQPKMISCKVKTVDHLQATYGTSIAGRQGTCEQVTRSLVDEARGRVGPSASAVVVEPEQQVWTGSSYLSPFELLARDEAGTLHINTRYMRIDWEDWRWYVMPNRLRGHLYCHVIAPDYLARLLQGEAPELQPVEIPTSPDAGWSWRRPFGYRRAALSGARAHASRVTATGLADRASLPTSTPPSSTNTRSASCSTRWS